MPLNPSDLNWTALEDAVFAWVRDTSGLDPAKIVHADQHFDAPDGPYITLMLGDVLTRGGPPEAQHSFDADRPAGEEVRLQARKAGELIISLQAFSADVTGSNTARTILGRVKSGLGLESIRATLNAAGIGIIDEGTVRRLPAEYGPRREDRALLEVRALVLETATEETGYIATVELVDLTGDDEMEL